MNGQEVAHVRAPDAKRDGRHEQDQEVAVGREEDALDEDHPAEAGEVAEHERRHAPTRPNPGLARRLHRGILVAGQPPTARAPPPGTPVTRRVD